MSHFYQTRPGNRRGGVWRRGKSRTSRGRKAYRPNTRTISVVTYKPQWGGSHARHPHHAWEQNRLDSLGLRPRCRRTQLPAVARGSGHYVRTLRSRPKCLQPAIDAAEPGDILNVTGTCFGNFTIDKDLILQGAGTLDGNDEGTVLQIAAEIRVTVADLIITNGVRSDNFCAFTRGGCGTYNSGTLTLNSASITGNSGGGIYNDCFGTVILNGSTTVSRNQGFGIDMDFWGLVSPTTRRR